MYLKFSPGHIECIHITTTRLFKRYETDSDTEEVDELPDPYDDEEHPRPGEPLDLRAWGIAVFNDRLSLAGKPKLDIENFDIVYKLMSDPQCLQVLVWTSADNDDMRSQDSTGDPVGPKVMCSHSFPPGQPLQEVYFFMKQAGALLTPFEDFDDLVQHGGVHGDYLDSLASSMTSIYSPLLSCHTRWPASVQNEFLSGMNKFMSTVTET